MAKIIINIKGKINKMKKQKGVSIISLVITVIVMITITAIITVSSMQTIGEADYSKYVSNLSDVSTAFHEKSSAVNGDKIAESNQKKEEQIYNYVAKAGKNDEEFLVQSEIPVYTIIKDEKQIGIKLPKIKVESGTGKKVNLQYATTKTGKVFTWPPYESEGLLYITPTDVVKTKLENYITVGGESFEIELDPIYGTLVDTNKNEYLENPSEEFIDGEHDFRSKTATLEYLCSEATCTVAATYYYKCLKCDEKSTMTYSYGKPLGHSHDEIEITKVATCGETGEKKATCIRCGDIQISTISKDKSNHVGSEISSVTKIVTCTEDGIIEYKCSTCNEKMRTQTTEALGHTFSEWVVIQEANCIEKGIKEKKCTRCSEVEKEETAIDSDNHLGGTIIVETVDPTCIDDGKKISKCSLCNTELNTEVISSLGHEYTNATQSATYLKNAATCVSQATYYYKCTRCTASAANSENPSNYIYVHGNVDKTNHEGTVTTHETEATETTAGRKWTTCDSCGAELSSKATYIVSAKAIYSATDNSLIFYKNDDLVEVGSTYNGREATNVYYGFERETYEAGEYITTPWWMDGIGDVADTVETIYFEDVITPISAEAFFAGFGYCEVIDLTNFDTSNVTSMKSLFKYTGRDSDSFTVIGLDKLNTTNVTTMECMFSYAGQNCPSITLNGIEYMNISNVTNTMSMFSHFGAYWENLSLDLSNWNVSNVTTMAYMFQDVGKNTDSVYLNLGGWNTSNVQFMNSMFDSVGASASSCEIIGIEDFDTGNVQNLYQTFCRLAESVPDFYLDLSGWDTSNVTNMWGTFASVGKNSENLYLNVSGWDTSKVTKMKEIFYNAGYTATSFQLIGVENWDLSSVTDKKNAFYYTGTTAGYVAPWN